jgi:MFS transporter, DHA2 family, metal-tetracycline-proton antiporter
LSVHHTPASDVPAQKEQGAISEHWVTILLGISIVLVIMNTMMFNLALPSVSRDYGLTASLASWIVTGYSIVFAIASITYSRLSDFIPLRRLLLTGIWLLGLAAIAGYFSHSFGMLLVVRIVQAAGAGAIPALSMVLVTRYIPLERRGKAMATVMSAASLGLGLGPVVGGAVVQYWGWHFLFVITALTLLLVPFFIRLIPKEKPAKGTFDILGALFIGAGTTSLLLFLTRPSLISLAAGIVAILLFVLRIRKAADPFVQPALFRNKSYLTLSAVGIAGYMCSFATLFLLPQILTHQFALNASEAGLVIFPGSLLAMLVSQRVGRMIDRYGNTAILRFAPGLLLGAAILFSLFASYSYVAILLIYMLMSLGFTFLTSSVSNEMSRLLPASLIGSGLGLFQLLQFFSGAFGVAITASALVWQQKLTLEAAYSNIYWGMSALVLAAIGCAWLYLRLSVSVKRNAEQHLAS